MLARHHLKKEGGGGHVHEGNVGEGRGGIVFFLPGCCRLGSASEAPYTAVVVSASELPIAIRVGIDVEGFAPVEHDHLRPQRRAVGRAEQVVKALDAVGRLLCLR